jgi:hypothetical protein
MAWWFEIAVCNITRVSLCCLLEFMLTRWRPRVVLYHHASAAAGQTLGSGTSSCALFSISSTTSLKQGQNES